MYHSVSSSQDSSLFSGMPGISIKTFENQLSYLLHNGSPISEKDIKVAAKTSIYPDDSKFYLTFDDGFKQHFNNVFPVLMDYGLHASFFIPTLPLETGIIPTLEKQRLLQYNFFSNYKEFLINFCELARGKARSEFANIFYLNDENINKSKEYLKEYDFYSNEERLFRLLRNKYLTLKDFEGIINDMFSKFYSNDLKFIGEFYMSILDLKKMSKNGMVIGGHSYSHPFLNKIPLNEMHQEVDKSMSFLRSKIDPNINTFAYPFGGYNENVIQYMREICIDYAFDTRTSGDNSQYNIRRGDVASFFNN